MTAAGTDTDTTLTKDEMPDDITLRWVTNTAVSFAASEVPGIFTDELRAAFSPLRPSRQSAGE
ncbi:hypothetical protein ACIRBZ_00595 [Streptomyces sp. NPDC094038]|uniref:hypothetical protein n=1 Tax=Streptomyces sp. NPDC094038 TaxID=3366055 RepID=UPI003821E540